MIGKQAMAITVIAAMAATALGVGAYSAFAQTETTTQTQIITVTGTGYVTYTPTRAVIELGVVTESTSVVDATGTNAQMVTSLLSKLSGLGLANYSVKTQSYSIYPLYDYSQGKNPTITGYRAVQNLEVDISENTGAQLGIDAGKVIDAAVSAGTNQVFNVPLTIPDSTVDPLRIKALQGASTQAQAKAEAIAQPLGLRLLSVQSVTEGGVYLPGPIVYASGAEGKPATTITPGPLTISASVQVVYRIG